MAIKTLQVTLGASATEVTTSKILCRWVQFQNNGANTMRLGDANVSATRGAQLLAGGAFFNPSAFYPGYAINLSQWFVAGTAADVLDIIYDDVV